MIGEPPPIQIVLAMAALGATVDYTQAGVAEAVTIRHARNRNPVRGERPAISLIIVEDDDYTDENRNDWEVVKELVVDLQVDIELPPEDSGLDPTGMGTLMKVAAAFVAALKNPGQPNEWMGGMVDKIKLGGLNPDDVSTPDDGRMTRRLSVLYRVRSEDENVLLAAGENA